MAKALDLLYLPGKEDRLKVRVPFLQALKDIGDLTVVENGNALSAAPRAALIRSHEVLLTMWSSADIPVDVARDPGKLRYVCNLTGSVRPWVPRELVAAGIPVTNWGDAPAHDVAEGAFALLMAVVKSLPQRARFIQGGGWRPDDALPSSSLEGLDIGIYGFGVIGRKFAQFCAPFEPKLRVFDPYAPELPPGLERVTSLEELCRQSKVLVIHAGLSDETRGSVKAAHLALLPDHGVVINTARGDILDQGALFAELEKGRLRAGLDVLAGNDQIPPEHPARHWPNLILTAHRISEHTWPDRSHLLTRYERYALENLGRFARGEALSWVMDLVRFDRST